MSSDESKLSIEQLISNAGNSNYRNETPLWQHPLALANAKMGLESNQLTKRTHELTDEQIKVSKTANELSEKLLLSNERASKQNEASAALMNDATQELAKSTSSLKLATWVLVVVSAFQAAIALLEFIKK